MAKFEIILLYLFNIIKMISTKCDKCKDKAWCWSCDECQSKQLSCFGCDKIITYRERHSHMCAHFNYPNQYLVCRKCNINKHILPQI